MNEPVFDDKCDQSYQICLRELMCPKKNWKQIISKARFTIDPKTMHPITSYTFDLDYPDNISIPNTKHKYVFKRSKFYEKFNNNLTRIHKDVTKYYADLGYDVEIFQVDRQWKLRLSWKNTEIKSPNIVVRTFN